MDTTKSIGIQGKIFSARTERQNSAFENYLIRFFEKELEVKLPRREMWRSVSFFARSLARFKKIPHICSAKSQERMLSGRASVNGSIRNWAIFVSIMAILLWHVIRNSGCLSRLNFSLRKSSCVLANNGNWQPFFCLKTPNHKSYGHYKIHRDSG